MLEDMDIGPNYNAGGKRTLETIMKGNGGFFLGIGCKWIMESA